MASHMTEGSQHKNFLLDHVENNIFQQSEQEFQTPEQREKPNDLKKPPPYKTKDSNSFSKPQVSLEKNVTCLYSFLMFSSSCILFLCTALFFTGYVREWLKNIFKCKRMSSQYRFIFMRLRQ